MDKINTILQIILLIEILIVILQGRKLKSLKQQIINLHKNGGKNEN